MGLDAMFDIRCWTSHRCGNDKNGRVQAIMDSFDHKVLIKACKETRGNSDIDCTIQPHWSMGTRNLVLEARFSDGVRWVLKILMLDTDGPCSTSSALGSASNEFFNGDEIYKTFQREYEAMEFIRFVSLTSKQTFLF